MVLGHEANFFFTPKKKKIASTRVYLRGPQRFEASNNLLSASNWPNVVVVGLNVPAHVAIAQVDVPRFVRYARERTARPIVVRLDVAEGTNRGQSRANLAIIDQTQQLLYVRQPPVSLMVSSITGIIAIITVHRAVAIQFRHVRESSGPISCCIRTIRILQPNQPRQIVGDGAVAIVRKARVRRLDPFLQIPVVPCVVHYGYSRLGHKRQVWGGRKCARHAEDLEPLPDLLGDQVRVHTLQGSGGIIPSVDVYAAVN